MSCGKNRATHLWVLAIAVIVGCFAFAGAASAATATTSGKGKAKTEVRIDFRKKKGRVFRYEVTLVRTKPKCEKNRKVIVWHDENRNGKLDKGEFVIRKGKTNRRGLFDFNSKVGPPVGDKIGVRVKANKKCKGAKASTTAS